MSQSTIQKQPAMNKKREADGEKPPQLEREDAKRQCTVQPDRREKVILMTRKKKTYDKTKEDWYELGVNVKDEEDWKEETGYALIPRDRHLLATAMCTAASELEFSHGRLRFDQSIMYDESGTFFEEQFTGEESKKIGAQLDCEDYDKLASTDENVWQSTNEQWLYTCELQKDVPEGAEVLAHVVVTVN